MDSLVHLFHTALATVKNVLPIGAVLIGFQVLVLQKPIPHLKRTLIGFVYVLVGLALFLAGLEKSLFPLGKLMAQQLSDPAFLGTASEAGGRAAWSKYLWVYAFGAAIGFATTVAEPALIAVAMKAASVSGGTLSVWGLRVAVAIGVALGIALGTFRIVTGTPIHWYIIAGYIGVVVQTAFSPRFIVPLAYDSGGVTTSTVTVPLVSALGLGLAGTVPGRSVLIDGFGLIAFASLFPMMTVMAYAQLGEWWTRRAAQRQTRAPDGP